MPRSGLLWRGLRLEFTTLAWNVVGSVFLLAVAVVARSVASVCEFTGLGTR